MDKVQKAIERLKLAAQMSETYYKKPLIVTTSGGKDSDVCIDLALKSGINFEVQHNHTTADAPETVYHVRETMRKLEEKGIKCIINKPVYKKQPVTMWSLIPQKLMPPTRLIRYCCQILKEQGGSNCMITTGVRWAESRQRKNRTIFEMFHRDKEKRILLNDNDDTRRLFENCSLKAKRVCNPIIDWTDEDVWNYIQSEKIEVCSLYNCGYKRVGCIGCPMASKSRAREFIDYPMYKIAYIRAFDEMLVIRKQKKLQTEWQTGGDVFHWWMQDGILSGQISLYEE